MYIHLLLATCNYFYIITIIRLILFINASIGNLLVDNSTFVKLNIEYSNTNTRYMGEYPTTPVMYVSMNE